MFTMVGVQVVQGKLELRTQDWVFQITVLLELFQKPFKRYSREL